MANNQSRKNITDSQNDRETNRSSGSRSARNDSRDGGEVVTLSDGRKFVRTPTTSFSGSGLKLHADEKVGFFRQWISDETDGHLQYYINLGFTQATDENGEMILPRAGGVRKNNTQYDMFLMEIPLQEHSRLKQLNKIADPIEEAKRNDEKWLNGQHNNREVNTYNPIQNNQKVL